MGFAEVLTLIFIVLKLTHEIDWSWWWVLSPELIAIGVYVAIWTLAIIGIAGAGFMKRMWRR